MRLRNILLGLLLSLFATALVAQDITGTIAGVVKDPSGAVVPKATVTITNTDKNIVARTVTSNDEGVYVAPSLPIGHYSVTAEAKGFKKASVTNIELNVNSKVTINPTMQIGTDTETVEVSADALQVDLQSTTATGLINGTQIRELSLNNRNYEQLVSLMPGVSYGGGDQLYIGTTNPSGQTNVVSFSINGQRNSANNWTVDGADNVDRGSNLTLLNYPSVDAIQEFKVLRGLYSADSGRAGAGQINVVTKSGGSSYHGDAYEFFRSDYLTANNYFANKNGVPRPPLRYNNFGYTFGGPVFIPGHYNTDKKKTFFFFSQEFRRVITYSTFTATVPTAAERQGTFIKPVCLDVRTAGSNWTSANCTATGTQITNINPIAQQYLDAIWSHIPDPQNGNVLVTAQRNIFNHRQELVKLDHVFNSKYAVNFRFIDDSIPTEEPGGLFTGAVLPGVSTTSTNSPGRNYAGHFTATFSPTLLLDAGYAFSYGAIISRPIGLLGDSSAVNVSMPFSSSLNRIPAVSATGISTITGFGPYNDFNRDHNAFANLTKIIGQHTIKWGATYHHYQKTENAAGNNAGTFAFTTTGQTASSVNSSNLERSWANFLLGNVSTFTQNSIDLTPDIQMNQWEAFAQDEWRLRSNLTLNYGVRYSLFYQPHDENRFLTNFDPSAFDPANAPQVDSTGLLVPNTGDPLNGILINGDSGNKYGNKVGKEAYGNWAPRLGIVWDPWGNGKTAVRAGYGMFFDSTLVGIYEQNIFGNPPFVDSATINNTRFENVTSGTPNVSLAPKTIRGTPVNYKTPNTQMWSLDIQRELGKGWILDTGYYGSKSTHLLGIIDINQPQPGQYVSAGLTTDTNGDGFPDFITSGLATQKLNIIRPFRGFGPINTIESIFNSNYNSLQMSLQKRFSGASQIALNYTYSKAMTDNQSDRSSAAQNSYDIAAEYGRSSLDRTHIFTASYVWELPWLKDKRDLLGYTLGGWQVSGIVGFNSGLPLTILSGGSVDPAGQGCKSASACSNRPDLVGDPNGQRNITSWFNAAAFTDIPAGQFRPGTSGRSVVTGPGYMKTDFSMFKNIPFGEQFRLQFRAEAFNLFNHTNFDGVGTTMSTTSTFGKVTSARDARTMQLGLKLYF